VVGGEIEIFGSSPVRLNFPEEKRDRSGTHEAFKEEERRWSRHERHTKAKVYTELSRRSIREETRNHPIIDTM
jgi:hypothetical protein